MAVVKTKGIIIKRINLGEADKILTILTADRGKIRAIAKGMRRTQAKLGGFLELFRYNEYLLAEGRNLDVITGASTIESFRQISLNLRKIGLAYYVAEIIDRLVEETQEANQIFELVYSVFREINSTKLPLDFIRSFFEFNMLSALGFKPELNKCIVCEKLIDPTQRFGFSIMLGGLVDNDHLFNDPHAIILDQSTAEVLCAMVNAPLKHFYQCKNLPEVIPQIAKISVDFLEYMLEKNLHSKEFLEEVLEF